MPRPSIPCPCGNPITPRNDGPIPSRCDACALMLKRYQSAMSTIRAAMASASFRAADRGRDALTLRTMADRLEPADPVLVIDEILDQLDLATMTPETAARIARRLDASSKRVLRRAGLLRRGTP